MTLTEIWIWATGLCAVLAAIIFAFTSWREKMRAASGLPYHSLLRLLIASLGGSLALFSAGSAAYFMVSELARVRSGSADDFMNPWLVAAVAAPPFLVGSLIWWLAMRRNSQ